MEKTYNYSDICLVPRYSELKSRSEADISVEFLGRRYLLPIVPANMLSVINEDIAKWLSENNYFYIFHRFGDTRKFIQRARSEAWKTVSISVGVNQTDKDLIDDIVESKCRVHVICIDIAHGFSVLMKEMIKYIKDRLPNTKIIAGNVWGDKDSIEALESWGADSIKCGLSCGAGCSTFATTSFGSPMFSAALEAGFYATVPLVIDGGIRTPGDITKAIVATTKASRYVPMVMIGSLLAACIDAPGENVTKKVRTKKCQEKWDDYYARDAALPKGHLVYFVPPEDEFEEIVISKKYFGSASAKNKQLINQPIKHIEGKEVLLECNGLTYEEKYEELSQALKSSVSYSGGKDLSALSKVQWVATT